MVRSAFIHSGEHLGAFAGGPHRADVGLCILDPTGESPGGSGWGGDVGEVPDTTPAEFRRLASVRRDQVGALLGQGDERDAVVAAAAPDTEGGMPPERVQRFGQRSVVEDPRTVGAAVTQQGQRPGRRGPGGRRLGQRRERGMVSCRPACREFGARRCRQRRCGLPRAAKVVS